MSISIAEVAKAAGVSTATVSRVLNDFPGVRSETVHQVHMAVEALNYRPQRTRRANKTGHPSVGRQAPRTGHIAAITLGQTRDWLQLPIMGAVVAGIQRAAGEFGLRLLLDDIPDPSKPSSLVQGRHIDGAVVFLTGSMPVTSYDPILAALRQRVPIVWAMGMEVTAGGVDHITPDNIRTGCIAHNYLHGEGCKHLAFLTTDPSWAFIRLRGQAFLNSACDAGAPATAYLVGDNDLVAQAYGQRVVLAPTLDQVVARLAAANPRPTGLFVACDRTTAQVYPVLARHGLQVGRDITLISCDNEQIRLSALHPRPASIDIGAEEIGFRSVVRLLARLRRPQEGPIVIQVSPRLAFSELPLQSSTDLMKEPGQHPTAAF